MTMEHQVFISYASGEDRIGSRDFQVAERICNNFEERDIRCWMAPRDITPGAD